MFEKILLPLDGSQLAEGVLPYGNELAIKLGSEIILLNVCSQEISVYRRIHQAYLDSLAELVRRQIQRYSPQAPVEVKAETLVGDPVSTICDYVDSNQIGLVLMSPNGTSGATRGHLGSTMNKIIRTIRVPTMLIRTQNDQPGKLRKSLINQILTPLDGSNASKSALPVAQELALKLHASIALFQMAPLFRPNLVSLAVPGATEASYMELNMAEEKAARYNLLNVERELSKTGIAVTHHIALGSDAANELIEISRRIGANLVVMSTRGCSPTTRWVFGSVTERVLRGGDLPLLLVPS